MADQSESNPKITQVADPRFKRLNDAFAKYLLAKEDHIGFLEDFVKAVIEHTPAEVPAHEVKSLVHRNVELYREHAKEKAGFLDIHAESAESDSGVLFDMDVQTYRDNTLLSRESFYFSKLYGSQQNKGEDHGDLKAVEIINLLSYNYFHDDTPYHTCCALVNLFTKKIVTDQIIFHFLEMPKSSRLDRWMQYFSCANPQEVLAFAKQDPLFSDVLEAEKMYLSDDDQMREYYRQNENAYWKGVLATAKAESKAEGIAEGRAEGIAEGEARGEARGIAKERKNLLEAARTMLSEGMDRLKVQHFTKLTDEEMASL